MVAPVGCGCSVHFKTLVVKYGFRDLTEWRTTAHIVHMMISPQEVADRLGYDVRTVYRWIKRGWLPAIKHPNRTMWIRESDLQRIAPHERDSDALAREARDAGAVV